MILKLTGLGQGNKIKFSRSKSPFIAMYWIPVPYSCETNNVFENSLPETVICFRGQNIQLGSPLLPVCDVVKVFYSRTLLSVAGSLLGVFHLPLSNVFPISRVKY